ncbi:MAG: TIGR00730 family Rossman fold protein [Ginsengibacter sp.]
MSINSVAVFCGSQQGNNPLFAKHAFRLGHLIAVKRITLVYGGGNKGLMGIIANAVLEKNGKVVGIIPKILTNREHHHSGISELHEVADMHTRKRMLYEMCDAAIILPGGYGTMDELFEILTWNQLAIHDKKIFILNSGGFYDHLILHLQNMEKESFLYHKLVDKLSVIASPDELII